MLGTRMRGSTARRRCGCSPPEARGSREEQSKGTIEPGKLADFAVLTEDYFAVPEERIDRIESALTVVDGKVVYGAAELERFAPRPPPVSPSWSPVARFGGYALAHTP